jgi:S1-C subfamily serine protease
MHLACEALGMALPGTTPVRANSEPMWRAVEQAARRVVEMTAEDLRPRDIILRLDDRSVKTVWDLRRELEQRGEGSSVRIGFIRPGEGTPRTVEVRVAERGVCAADHRPVTFFAAIDREMKVVSYHLHPLTTRSEE